MRARAGRRHPIALTTVEGVLHAQNLDAELAHAVFVEDAVRRIRVVVRAHAGMITTDDEMRASVVAPDDRVEHRLLGPRVPHPRRVRRKQRALSGKVLVEQLAIARHAHICGDVIALRLTDERVQQQPVDDLERDLLQILVGAMHRIAGLKPHHGSPAEVRHPRTHLERRQVVLRKPGRRLDQRDH